MPFDRSRYVPDWEEISLRIRKRSDWKCERCKAPNGETISRHRLEPGHYKLMWSGAEFNEDGTETGMQRLSEYDGRPPVIVVLTVAHLDHDPQNNADDNLRALCQRCHLIHDAEEHRVNSARTRRRKSGNLTLPGVEP